jgi:hypothetical protein
MVRLSSQLRILLHSEAKEPEVLEEYTESPRAYTHSHEGRSTPTIFLEESR